MRRRHWLGAATLAALPLALWPWRDATAQGATVPVHGQLISRSQGPVPGVAVSLLHPVLGRSLPSYTDIYGRFGWSAIPIRPEAYFLEIYWGNQLIYRQPLQVHQPLMLPPIYL